MQRQEITALSEVKAGMLVFMEGARLMTKVKRVNEKTGRFHFTVLNGEWDGSCDLTSIHINETEEDRPLDSKVEEVWALTKDEKDQWYVEDFEVNTYRLSAFEYEAEARAAERWEAEEEEEYDEVPF